MGLTSFSLFQGVTFILRGPTFSFLELCSSSPISPLLDHGEDLLRLVATQGLGPGQPHRSRNLLEQLTILTLISTFFMIFSLAIYGGGS